MFRRLIGALILLSGCLRGSAAPEPRTAGWAVPGGDLALQLARAAPGDTVILSEGVYEGNLLLDRRVTLLGTPGTVVRGSGTGSVLTVVADSCTVAGLSIEHSGTQLVREDAGILIRSAHNTIRDNTLRDVLFAIYLFRAEQNTVVRNAVAGRPGLSLGDRGSGIHIWNAQHNVIDGNTITDVRDGLYLQNASHTTITGNSVTGVRYGLHYMYADSNVFLRNAFCRNVAGAAIMYSTGIVMRHNVFAHNRGFSSFGVLFQDCHGLTADSNVIADNVVGMFFEASTGNTFRDNIIARNDVALQMFQNAEGNSISRNTFIDNLSPMVVVGKRTGTRWDECGRGNYWSSYGGYDLDGDGVGDVPMNIQNVFQYLEGKNPAVRLYLYSPASQALAGAAEAFPILRFTEERDSLPLMRPVPLGGIPAMELLLQQDARDAARGGAWVAFPLAGVLLLGFTVFRLRRKGAA